MRITYIAAGAAGSYCGACARDVALVRALRARGHDVQMLPLYTPIRTDGPDPSLDRVFYGGINVYLQQCSSLFRTMPRALDWLLDRPVLLRLASRFAIRTRPEGLGELTVSVLEGPAGRQRKELEKLIRYLEDGPRPDVVNLTNSLLAGLAPAVRDRLGVPIVCTLQGEESFIARLPADHRERATAVLREHARTIEAFVAPCRAYAAEMARFLDVPEQKIRVVRAGVEIERYAPAAAGRSSAPFRVGFLSRLSWAKGLDLLCEAFRMMEERRPGGCLLSVAGQAAGPDRAFWEQLRAGLVADGLADRVEYAGELDFPDKVRFLQDCSVFCVPERMAEPRGMACLEAMAAGVPAVMPMLGVFPEIAELTGGAVCVPPDDARALADALSELQDDPERVARMGGAAAAGVAEHFSAGRMADETLAVYAEVAAARANRTRMA